jgi:hypothetical protein
MHLIWDDIELDDIDDDIIEEACVGNNYNLRSKGAPKTNNSPTTSKTGSSKQTEDNGRNSTTTQPTTSMDLT